jgi:hypothetical protein
MLSIVSKIVHINNNNHSIINFKPPIKYLTFDNKAICFTNCNNSFLTGYFPKVETLFINNCNKNFVYYNLNPILFPNVTTIFCNSYPDELYLFCHHAMFNKRSFIKQEYYLNYYNNLNILITEDMFDQCFIKWYINNNIPYIKKISKDYMVKQLELYKEEKIIMND